MAGHPLFDPTGRRAMAAGGGRGIGFALAGGLAEAGAEIAITARDAARLETAADALRAGGAVARAAAIGAADYAARRASVDRVEAEVGPVDILVNNAGMQHRAAPEDFPPEAFETLTHANVSTVFNVGQAVARHMIGRGGGEIVDICSVQSALARPSIPPCTATEGAVAKLTEGMATDGGRRGLQVNGLAPGCFRTELNAAPVADGKCSASLAQRTPSGGWDGVSELVGAGIFLAAPASSCVNGAILSVDGGTAACP